MNDNICGTCDYCDESRSNEVGQLRCMKNHCYVDFESSCSDYSNMRKEQIYNSILGVMKSVGIKNNPQS